jgi:hypothetical protein
MKHCIHIFRVSKYNCFVGKLDTLPGIHEFQCLRIQTTNMRAFEKKLKSLSVNNQEEYTSITASIEVGDYCIKRSAFVDCILRYEPSCDELHREVQIEDTIQLVNDGPTEDMKLFVNEEDTPSSKRKCL